MNLLPLLLLLSSSAAVAHAGDVEPYPSPRSPDALVENLERALEELSVVEYERLLDWTYLFEFAPEHSHLAPNGWMIDEELEAMRRLLAGEPTRFDGRARRVTDLQVDLRPLGPWEERGSDDYGLLRTWTRSYAGRIRIEFDDDSSVFIHRRQVLTVGAGRSEADMEFGEFRLLRWEEEESLGRFGAVKVRF